MMNSSSPLPVCSVHQLLIERWIHLRHYLLSRAHEISNFTFPSCWAVYSSEVKFTELYEEVSESVSMQGANKRVPYEISSLEHFEQVEFLFEQKKNRPRSRSMFTVLCRNRSSAFFPQIPIRGISFSGTIYKLSNFILIKSVSLSIANHDYPSIFLIESLSSLALFDHISLWIGTQSNEKKFKVCQCRRKCKDKKLGKQFANRKEKNLKSEQIP